MEYLLLLLSVMLTSLSQIWQKTTALKLSLTDKAASGSLPQLHHVRQVIAVPEAWFALTSLGASMLLWLWVLKDMDVSKAFPLVSISLVLVMLVARFKFGEFIPLRRWMGAVIITLGVCLVAGS